MSNAFAPSRSRAFTLLELLVVIAIILILVAMVSVVGSKVFDVQKSTATKGVLLTLDKSLDEYKEDTGAFPKYKAQAYQGVPGPDWSALGDGLNKNYVSGPVFTSINNGPTLHHRRPSAAAYFEQAKGSGDVDAILRGIPTTFVRPTPRTVGGQDKKDAVTLVDAWADTAWEYSGTPSGGFYGLPALRQTYIIYVHPDNDVAQALYGSCVNGRPYFMSGGPDKKLGLRAEDADQYPGEPDPDYRARIEKTLSDNIYSYPVGPIDRDTTVFQNIR